jgi:hypothetical protein
VKNSRVKQNRGIQGVQITAHVGTRKEEWKDEEWGRYPPEWQYNMDQVLLPFVIDQNTTHAIDEEEHIHIQSPGADGLDKQVAIHHAYL